MADRARAEQEGRNVEDLTPEEAADELTRESERLGLYDEGDDRMDYSKDPVYFPPPREYVSVAQDGCATCGQIIGYFPVIGGHKWSHIVRPDDDHEVALTRPWWDTHIGEYRTDVFVSNGQPQEPAVGMTPDV